jgi:hypothetical protein
MNGLYTVSLKDTRGLTATATADVTLAGTATATQIAADLATFATNVAAMTAAKVIKMEAKLISTASPAGVVPGDFAVSDIGDVGNIVFPVGSTLKTWTFVIPAVKPSLVVGNAIDDTADAFTALAAEMGAPGTYSTFTDPKWIALGEPVATFLSDRTHRRREIGLTRRTLG